MKPKVGQIWNYTFDGVRALQLIVKIDGDRAILFDFTSKRIQIDDVEAFEEWFEFVQ